MIVAGCQRSWSTESSISHGVCMNLVSDIRLISFSAYLFHCLVEGHSIPEYVKIVAFEYF